MRDRYIARASNIASRILGGEAIVMNPADSTFFSLNELATEIWEAANGDSTLEQIVGDRICTHYEVDWETAIRDAEEFVQALAAHQMLLIAPDPFQTEPRRKTSS